MNIKKQKGFSFVEVLIVMAIVAVLSSVIVPSLSQFTRKARRAEAITALLNTKKEYEQFYTKNSSYPVSNANLPADTKHYDFSSTVTGREYTLTATGLLGQVNDKVDDESCKELTIDNTGYTNPPECWR